MPDKEYGGYLPLELRKGKHYYQSDAKQSVLRLNSGRSAIVCAIRDFRPTKIYIPYYNCIHCAEAISNTGIELEYYSLDNDMLPAGITVGSTEMLLWVNYYGNASAETALRIANKHKNVIIDNAQAFFSLPIGSVYNCYSPRKFFGVPDGGYLIKEKFNIEHHYAADESHSRSAFLLKSLELGTNEAYLDHLDNESAIEKEPLSMSELTNALLGSIMYEQVRAKRKANLLTLHGYLRKYNEFDINLESDTHMVYPFLYTKEQLRDYLVDNKVYTPTWWRHVPEACDYADMETTLTEFMCYLPIDQRYDANDMKDISDIILRRIKG